MSNLNTTTYVKKLVKIIYEKEKQIENLKNTIKTKQSINIPSEEDLNIDPELKNQLEQTSLQLKLVNKQVIVMQGKMIQLSLDLKEQIQKNTKLEQKIAKIKKDQNQMNKIIQMKTQQLQSSKRKIKNLQKNIEEITQKLVEESFQNKKLTNQLEALKEEKVKEKYENTLLIKQLNPCKAQLKQKQKEFKQIQAQSLLKIKTLQQISQINLRSLQETKITIIGLTQKITEIQSQNASLFQELQSSKNSYNMKENQLNLLSEKLKDYEQFAFQISHYIESSYVKHICKGSLRSSKKITRQNQNYHNKFESIYSKINQLELWMQSTSERLQKVMKDQQIPCGTLQNLSIIAHSFQQKLQLCNLTARIEKERMQNDINEEILLKNLQKQCQKSYQIERSKVTQLGELKQILKMTKDVNRELMDQVNKKEHIINECKKTFIKLMGSKQNTECKAIKKLLNINN